MSIYQRFWPINIKKHKKNKKNIKSKQVDGYYITNTENWWQNSCETQANQVFKNNLLLQKCTTMRRNLRKTWAKGEYWALK